MPIETPATLIDDMGDVIVVRVKFHDMTEEHVKAVQTDVNNSVLGKPAPVIMDISLVKYVPSLALGVFVRLANSFKAKQQRFILAAPQHTVRQVLAITRLDRAMEIQDTVEAALKLVRPG